MLMRARESRSCLESCRAVGVVQTIPHGVDDFCEGSRNLTAGIRGEVEVLLVDTVDEVPGYVTQVGNGLYHGGQIAGVPEVLQATNASLALDSHVDTCDVLHSC